MDADSNYDEVHADEHHHRRLSPAQPCAHLLGWHYNRRRGWDLRNHAKLTVRHNDKMEKIHQEVQCCENLLLNVFPKPTKPPEVPDTYAPEG